MLIMETEIKNIMDKGKYQVFEIESLCRKINQSLWQHRLPASKGLLIIIKHQVEGVIIGIITDYNFKTSEIICKYPNQSEKYTFKLSDIIEIYEFIKIVK